MKADGLISVKEEISGMISVTVLMEDPRLASDIANYIAEYVKSFISIEQKREAARNKVFVEKQMEDAKTQLDQAQKRYSTLSVKSIRLKAEVNGKMPNFPKELVETAPNAVSTELALYTARLDDLNTRSAILEQRRIQK